MCACMHACTHTHARTHTHTQSLTQTLFFFKWSLVYASFLLPKSNRWERERERERERDTDTDRQRHRERERVRGDIIYITELIMYWYDDTKPSHQTVEESQNAVATHSPTALAGHIALVCWEWQALPVHKMSSHHEPPDQESQQIHLHMFDTCKSAIEKGMIPWPVTSCVWHL